MTRFNLGQKITVISDHGNDKMGALIGRTGTVVRLVMRSTDEAWINIEGEPIPREAACFPADDEHGRGNHVCLWLDECAAVGN